jgi:hypothetical protein
VGLDLVVERERLDDQVEFVGDFEDEVSADVDEALVPVLRLHLEPVLDGEQHRDSWAHPDLVPADVDVTLSAVQPLDDDFALGRDVSAAVAVHLRAADAQLVVAHADVLEPEVLVDRSGVPAAAGVEPGKCTDRFVGVPPGDRDERAHSWR